MTEESTLTDSRVEDTAMIIFFCALAYRVINFKQGRVAEWLMAPVLKTGVPERVSGVRIPPLPPFTS